MKNNKDLLLEKILFLMRYDLSKTSKENVILKEQPDSRFLDSDTKQILAKGEEQIKKDEELEKSNQELLNSCKYGCRYPENTICPSKNEAGMEGKDAMIAGYCFYPCASIGYSDNISGIFIENDAEILFFNNSFVIKWVQNLIGKNPERYSDKDYDYLYDNLTRIFKPGTVIQFKDSKGTWKNLIRYNSDIGYWESIGFYDENRNPYVQPKWVDVRTGYQKFVDEWGTWLQVGAAVVTAIAGGLTGGAAWVITAEIITEMGLGIMVGSREIQKGSNVSAVVSFATGVLPFFKLVPGLKGISRSKFKSLQDKILASGLKENPTQAEMEAFIKTLDDDENLIMKKMLQGDDASIAQMQSKLSSANLSDFEDVFLSEIKEVLKANPDLFQKIDFWDRLWVRELSANAIVGVVGLAINATLGYKLNDAEMEVLDGIYTVTPDGQKKDLIYSLGSQPEVTLKIVQSEESKETLKELATQKIKESGDVYLNNYEKRMKTLFEKNGGTYKSTTQKSNNLTDEEKYRKEGYTPLSEWGENKPYEYSIRVNGKIFVKN